MKTRDQSIIVKEVFEIIGNQTAKEISEKSGLNETTAWRIVRGVSKVNVDQIELIMKGYGITWSRLMWRLSDPKRGRA